MRFETTEKIEQQDTELVLRTLEHCLRDVSVDVKRSGEEIVLHGLGPSPLAVNHRDKTVLRVENKETENVTVIRADVTFQASSLLGNAPQCDVVRSKLDRVFQRVRMQIDFETGGSLRRVATVAETTSHTEASTEALAMQPLIEGSEVDVASESGFEESSFEDVKAITEPFVYEEQPVLGGSAESPSAEESSEIAAAEDIKYEKEPAQEQSASASMTNSPAESVAVIDEANKPHRQEELADETILVTRSSTRAVFVDTPHAVAEPILATKDFASAKSYAGPKHNWTAAMLACALLLFGPGLYFAHRQQEAASPPQSQPAITAPAAVPDTAPPASQESQPAPVQETAATENRSVDSSDPQLWLQSWLAAQATGDAPAQASFYADKVDRYLGKRNVTHAEILVEKQSDMLRRQGRWTVKLEDVNLRRKDNGEVSVYLVKHYEAQTEPAEIAEQYVPSHLELRRIDGQWKIVSEQDLPITEPAQAH